MGLPHRQRRRSRPGEPRPLLLAFIGDKWRRELAMPDDTDKRDIAAEEATYISRANHRLEGKQAALDVVSHVPALREIAVRDAVCDDQADELNEAITALRQAGDAIWPGDEGMPPLEELAAWPDEDESPDEESDDEATADEDSGAAE